LEELEKAPNRIEVARFPALWEAADHIPIVWIALDTEYTAPNKKTGETATSV